MLKHFFKKADKILLKWLGIHNAEKPIRVKLVNNEVIIISSEANRRYQQKNMPPHFFSYLSKIKLTDRKKLGVAVGKAIASNLIISFDNAEIKIKKS